MSKNLIPISQAEQQLKKHSDKPPTNGLTPDEIKIAEANKGAFIQDASKSDLLGLLAHCMGLSGINPSNFPDDSAKAVLIDFLLSSYSSFRIEEVRTAFQMLAAGRFGEIDHYQNFSPMYVGKVMAAFRKKSEELKRYQESARSFNQPYQPLTHRDELSDEYCVNASFANYQKIGKWELIYPVSYRTLERYGHGLTDEQLARVKRTFDGLKDKNGKYPFETPQIQLEKMKAAAVFNSLKPDFKL